MVSHLQSCPMTLQSYRRGPMTHQLFRIFQMALAAGMTATNLTTDPRGISLMTCSYHTVELSTASGLLVGIPLTTMSLHTYIIGPNSGMLVAQIVHASSLLLILADEHMLEHMLMYREARCVLCDVQISSPLDSCPEDDICAVKANISIVANNTSPYALAFAAYWAAANNSFQASNSCLNAARVPCASQQLLHAIVSQNWPAEIVCP